MSEAPLRIVVGCGTQTDVDEMQGSTDKGTQMATTDEAYILHSRTHLVLVNNEGESSRQGSCNLGALFGTIGKVDE